MARDVMRGAAAAMAALGVMAAAAAAGLWMLGVPVTGPSVVAAVVALACGGRVTAGMSADNLPFGGAGSGLGGAGVGGTGLDVPGLGGAGDRIGALAGVSGELSLMPLGVTALGALTLAACLLARLRRSAPGGTSAAQARSGRAVSDSTLSVLTGSAGAAPDRAAPAGAVAWRALLSRLPAGRVRPGRARRGRTSLVWTSRGHTSLGRTPLGRTSWGWTSRGRTSLGRTSLGRTSLGRTSLGRTSLGRTSFRRAPLDPAVFARRGIAALVVWTAGLTFAASLGHGTLTGLAILPGSITFAADVASTATGGLLLGLGLLAFLLMSSTTLGDRLRIRPAASALGVVATVIALLGAVVSLLAGPLSPGDDRIGGVLLLLLPNAVAVLGGIGVGESWRLDTSGILANRWPGSDLALPTLDGRLPLIAILFAAGTLIGCGLLTAHRTPAGPHRALRAAAGLGLALAVLLPCLTMLATGRLAASITVFTFSLTGFTAGLTADPWTAGLLGLAAGALAGLTGFVVTTSAGRIVRLRRRDTPGPVPSPGSAAADPAGQHAFAQPSGHIGRR